MPLGKRVLLGTRLPLPSRVFSAQQSSRFTYWYPASLRPRATKMSAMPLTMASLKSARQAVLFQLLNPIGGVRANPFSSADAGWAVSATAPARVSPAAARAETSLRDGYTQVPPWSVEVHRESMTPPTTRPRPEWERRGSADRDSDVRHSVRKVKGSPSGVHTPPGTRVPSGGGPSRLQPADGLADVLAQQSLGGLGLAGLDRAQ